MPKQQGKKDSSSNLATLTGDVQRQLLDQIQRTVNKSCRGDNISPETMENFNKILKLCQKAIEMKPDVLKKKKRISSPKKTSERKLVSRKKQRASGA